MGLYTKDNQVNPSSLTADNDLRSFGRSCWGLRRCFRVRSFSSKSTPTQIFIIEFSYTGAPFFAAMSALRFVREIGYIHVLMFI